MNGKEPDREAGGIRSAPLAALPIWRGDGARRQDRRCHKKGMRGCVLLLHMNTYTYTGMKCCQRSHSRKRFRQTTKAIQDIISYTLYCTIGRQRLQMLVVLFLK